MDILVYLLLLAVRVAAVLWMLVGAGVMLAPIFVPPATVGAILACVFAGAATIFAAAFVGNRIERYMDIW